MCHRACEVPFYPNGSKPIFCSTCFDKNGGRESKRFNGMSPTPRHAPSPSYGGGSDSGVAEQLKKINAKLDLILSQLDV
jgi:CxxC-x17-CxxC domain-containing protein